MNEENNDDTHKTLNTVSVLVPVSGISRTVADRLADEDEKRQQHSTSLPLYYYNDDRVSTYAPHSSFFFSIFIQTATLGG